MAGEADGHWVDLRAPGSGRLLARYDPGRRLLEIRRGGEAVLFDLERDPAPSETTRQPGDSDRNGDAS